MEFSAVPRHIGFIMDGNGRWAKLRGYPRVKGHRAGLKTVDNVLDLCKKYGVSYVSLYVFSTENWSRPKEEVDNLFNLAREYLKKSNGFRKRDIRVVVSGSMAELPADLAAAVANIERDTCGCASLTLNLCINYGGRDEIIHAVNRMVADGVTADEKTFETYLYKKLPPLDLVARTSGEMRLSNFMLYQAAYAELYFTDVLWPDFDENEFRRMLVSYAGRERKFGDIK